MVEESIKFSICISTTRDLSKDLTETKFFKITDYSLSVLKYGGSHHDQSLGQIAPEARVNRGLLHPQAFHRLRAVDHQFQGLALSIFG